MPPPGGPAIVGVVERNYANAVEQDILLATSGRTPGQNRYRVRLYGPVDAGGSGQTRLSNLPLAATDRADQRAEWFPGVPMHVSSLYVQNRYGPFGYAFGRSSSGDLCLHAWQRIRAPDRDDLIFGGRGTIRIELRNCQRGQNEQQLLGAMYGFTISAYFDDSLWNPFGAPQAPDPELGKTGGAVYPVGARGYEPVTDNGVFVETPPRPAARPRRVVVKTEPEPQPRTEPKGPTVPSPPGGSAPAASSDVAPATPARSVTVPPPPCAAPATDHGSC